MADEKKKVKSPVEKTKVAPISPKGDIKATGGLYRAERKCYFGIRLYAKGAELHTEKGDMIPRHFKKVVRMVEVTEEEE